MYWREGQPPPLPPPEGALVLAGRFCARKFDDAMLAAAAAYEARRPRIEGLYAEAKFRLKFVVRCWIFLYIVSVIEPGAAFLCACFAVSVAIGAMMRCD